MLNRWISKRVNVVSLIIALVYWILACMVLYDWFYVGFDDLKEPYYDFPEWLIKFLYPGFYTGFIAAIYGGIVLVYIVQFFTLLALIQVVRIIVVFFFALFGWEEE